MRRLLPAIVCGVALSASSFAQTVLYSRVGDKDNDRLSTSVRSAGDVNMDGRPDFIVGATEEAIFGPGGEGFARVYSGANGSTLHTLNGAKADERFGFAVDGVGDVNNDGYADWVVGAPNGGSGNTTFGRVVVYRGPSATVAWTFNGAADGDKLGYSVAGAGDVNNDGYSDIIAGAPYAANGGVGRGMARVYSGATGAVLWTINGTTDNGLLGFSVDGCGDVNGDNYDDFVVGSSAVGAKVYSGQNASVLRTYTAAMNDRLGISVSGVGDCNGDLIPDILVGATQDGNIFSVQQGFARLFSGAGPGAVTIRTLTGDGNGDRFGISVGDARDLNLDDLSELIVGADQTIAGLSGYARVSNGADGATIHTVLGTDTSDRFGVSVDGLGDCDGDGKGEFIVGSPVQSDVHSLGGEAKVFTTTASRVEPGTPYCAGDNLDPLVTTDCPCGNFGDAGRGCANSNSALGGAHLYATGSTNPNTVVLICDGVANQTLCVFLRAATSVSGGAVFGDGVSCLSGQLVRFGGQLGGQNGNPPNTVSIAAANPGAGLTRYYQVQYRNVSSVFCTPALYNISNGYQITW